MVTVPLRVTFSVEDAKKEDKGSSDESSTESDASEESIPDLEKEMQQQMLRRSLMSSEPPPHVIFAIVRLFIPWIFKISYFSIIRMMIYSSLIGF
jgi:hypothetical protein